jgi:biopolymer transport protein ExbD
MKIEKNKKILLLIPVLAVVLIFLIFQIAIKPLREAKKIKSKLPQLEQDFRRIESICRKYSAINNDQQILEKRLKERERNFSLDAYLRKIAKDKALLNKLAKVSPKSIRKGKYEILEANVILRNLSAKELVSYLHALNISDNILKIDKLEITNRFDEKGDISLKVTFDISTIKLK